MNAETPIEVTVRLHPRQYELHRLFSNPKINRVYARTGRRWGKSFLVAYEIVDFGIANPYSPRWLKLGMRKTTKIAVFAPDYRRSRRIWDELKESFNDFVAKFKENEMRLWLYGGAEVEFFSGAHIGSIRGGGYDVLIGDEVFAFSEFSFDNDVVPAGSDRQARIWLISTPKFGRRNWYSKRILDAEKRSRAGEEGAPAAFHSASWENTLVDKAYLDTIRLELDDLTWREEFGAEILDAHGQVLDPSLLRYVEPDKVPQNCFTTLHCDTAFGWPDRESAGHIVDSDTRRRKDRSVLNVIQQDALGMVYSRDGYCSPDIEMDEFYERAVELIRRYDCRLMVMEHVGQDWFTKTWEMHTRNLAHMPAVGIVRPTRPAHWKPNAMREWSMLLQRSRFFVVEGNPLLDPLIEEMEEWTEFRAATDKVKDDVLVTNADVMLDGVYQGHREVETRGRRRLPRIYATPEEEDYEDQRPRRSRYSIL